MYNVLFLIVVQSAMYFDYTALLAVIIITLSITALSICRVMKFYGSIVCCTYRVILGHQIKV